MSPLHVSLSLSCVMVSLLASLSVNAYPTVADRSLLHTDRFVSRASTGGALSDRPPGRRAVLCFSKTEALCPSAKPERAPHRCHLLVLQSVGGHGTPCPYSIKTSNEATHNYELQIQRDNTRVVPYVLP